MASVVYGNSGKEPATTSIYTYHLDSRNRNKPLTTTPSTYTINLGASVPRVKTIQVGDVELPTDARSVVDYARRHFQLSEPLKITEATTLAMQETTRVYDIRTGALLSTTVQPGVSVSFPALVNPVASTSGNTLTTTNDHHMASVLAYWPSAVPSSLLVGARVVNADALVNVSTVDGTTPFPSDTEITLDAAYVANLLANYTVGPLTDLEDMTVGLDANASLYVQPLTIPEWVAVINAAMADLGLTQSYQLSLNANTGLVELRCTGGDTTTGSRRVETSVEFTVTQGDALWRLGFPPGTWELPTYKNPRIDNMTGQRADSTPYVMAVVARDTRTIQLRRGKYTSIADLTEELTRATNSLYLPETLSSGARTLTFTDVTGAERTVIVPVGRYDPQLLALFLTTAMNTAPTIDGQFDVAVNVTQFAGAGGFTISDTLGRPFVLDFSDPTAAPLASLLGFEPLRLANASSYTSTREALGGLSAAGDDFTSSRVISWSANTANTTLRAVSSKPIPSFDAVLTPTGIDNEAVVVSTQLGTGAGGTPVMVLASINDLVRFSDGTNSVLSLVTLSPLQVGFGAVLLGAGNDLDTTVPALTGTPISRPDFVLHMARLPISVKAADVDITGITMQNATLDNPAANKGMGVSYGPLYDQLGFQPTTVSSDTSGMVLAPAVYSLTPPAYILMELQEPAFVSERAVFRPDSTQDTRPVLAKFIVTDGFARITEESTHVTATSVTNITKVKVAWLNPDGTLVDWNGANHSYALMFRMYEGHVAGVGMD